MRKYKNTDSLTEVKKGQTGRGLLIEHDGHIVGNDDLVRQIREDVAHHHEFVIPDKFTVNAVFQKYGIKNANGRVYPEAVLKREVEKYINERVNTRSAIGALDHPECLQPETKIMAENGWVNIEDVKEGDRILTLTEDKNIELHPVMKKIDANYNGKMVRLWSEGKIDLTVTPNHKFPLFDENRQFAGFFTADRLIHPMTPEDLHTSGLGLLKTRALSVGADDGYEFREYEELICIGDISMEETDYVGTVHCVEVENHTFYVMDINGHCAWSGNSTTLSGHDVSHVITELHWVGRTLVGTMDLHLSPGYRRYGICSTSGDLAANMILDGIQIGVSSRAIGSVEERLGVLEVGDDLDLVSWDVVCEPSTPGAFISNNLQDLEQFIESNDSRDDSMLINEKIKRINQILL